MFNYHDVGWVIELIVSQLHMLTETMLFLILVFHTSLVHVKGKVTRLPFALDDRNTQGVQSWF